MTGLLPGDSPKPDPKELYPQASRALDSAVNFTTTDFAPDQVSAQLGQAFNLVRRANFPDTPALTSDAMTALTDNQGIKNFPILQDVMRRVVVPGTAIKVYNGTGTIVMINSVTGEALFTEARGPVHDLFAGGLADYAASKTSLDAGLVKKGKLEGLIDNDDILWLEKATGRDSIHLGWAHGVDEQGRLVHCGVSGAEMKPNAIRYLRSMLKPDSQDGDFTVAGFMDQLAAQWALKVTRGEPISPQQAQQDINRAFKLFEQLDSGASLIPSYFH